MNSNSENKDKDILKIWAKAGKTLNSQQQLNKEKMETLLSKTSTEFSSGIKRLLKADAIFKVVMIFGFITIAAFNLNNLFVLGTSLVCIILGAMTIKQNRILIEGLNELAEYKGNIRSFLEKDIMYYKRNIFRHPFTLTISVFLFYVLGSMVYYEIKYDTIRPIQDLEDGVVVLFLIFSTLFSFVIYYPYFTSRIDYLQKLLNDIDHADLINNHIKDNKIKKRKKIIITSILIILGVLALTTLIIAIF